MTHAEGDVHLRMLQEQRVEADRTVEALDAAMAKDGEAFLDSGEKAQILAAREKLLAARDGDESEQIKQSLRDLEAASQAYVARRMNATVGELMRGTTISNYE